MIIVSTVTQDYRYPAAACLVGNYIGATGAAAFDISAACTGFIYGVDIADSFIKSGKAKNNCVLFGDGAGAAVLSAQCGEGENQSGVLSTYINCESDGGKPLFIRSRKYEPGEIFGRETKLFKGNAKKISESYLWQNGREVMQFVSKIALKSLDAVLEKTGLCADDLDHIILHQANKRILEYVIEKYGLNPDKVPINIDKYGNISSATVPVLLHELCASGKINKGSLVALVGFGSGLAYGAALVRW
jgi:3-oxoacyl-[acyl-carrier-protein] synthase-3